MLKEEHMPCSQKWEECSKFKNSPALSKHEFRDLRANNIRIKIESITFKLTEEKNLIEPMESRKRKEKKNKKKPESLTQP